MQKWNKSPAEGQGIDKMFLPLLSSLPTCFSTGTPSGRRRPNRQGNPFPNSHGLVNSLISFLAIKYPRRGRRPAPALSAPEPRQVPPRAGHGAGPKTRAAFRRRPEPPSAPPDLFCAGLRCTIWGGRGWKNTAVPSAATRSWAAQGSGPRCWGRLSVSAAAPGRVRGAAGRRRRGEYARLTEPEGGRQRGGAAKEDAAGG